VSVALVTGSAGLIGSEAVRHFAGLGLDVVGIDNDMRSQFFGAEASTAWNVLRLTSELGDSYSHHDIDIRDRDALAGIFRRYGRDIAVVIHTAAQPSHDWAVRDPYTDFDVNAGGTLNVLQNVREHCIEAPVIHCSTNKVYGDRPNSLPYEELATRYELPEGHTYFTGIREDMSIDACLHSVFGASKVAADVMVQEYGRYFDMKTACFRGGTLTGPNHAAAELHGFLAYVVRCAMTHTPYTIFGYQGKQVRDAIHSSDLIACFDEVHRAPRVAEVYNIGGGRHSNVSVLEAIDLVQEVTGEEMTYTYDDTNRVGDHIWWISDNGRFASHYPGWKQAYDVRAIAEELFERNREHWTP